MESDGYDSILFAAQLSEPLSNMTPINVVRCKVQFNVRGRLKWFYGKCQVLFDGRYYVAFDDGDKYTYDDNTELVFLDAKSTRDNGSDTTEYIEIPSHKYCAWCGQAQHKGLCDVISVETKTRLRSS